MSIISHLGTTWKIAGAVDSVKTSINSSKFYKLWSENSCRRLQRQKKWELPASWAENFPIHVPFPVPVVSVAVEYAVISGEKLFFCEIVPFQSQGPVIFNLGPGPKTKILSFLTLGDLARTCEYRFRRNSVTTHRILAILLDDIEMILNLFFKKNLAEKPKVSGGFRSVVGTAGWQKLKETAAV